MYGTWKQHERVCKRKSLLVIGESKETIYLDVTNSRRARASTAGSYARTILHPYRYRTGGSSNQKLIAMDVNSGGAVVETYAPNGWNILKSDKYTYIWRHIKRFNSVSIK